MSLVEFFRHVLLQLVGQDADTPATAGAWLLEAPVRPSTVAWSYHPHPRPTATAEQNADPREQRPLTWASWTPLPSSVQFPAHRLLRQLIQDRVPHCLIQLLVVSAFPDE
jgi:hypothetical protein